MVTTPTAPHQWEERQRVKQAPFVGKRVRAGGRTLLWAAMVFNVGLGGLVATALMTMESLVDERLGDQEQTTTRAQQRGTDELSVPVVTAAQLSLGTHGGVNARFRQRIAVSVEDGLNVTRAAFLAWGGPTRAAWAVDVDRDDQTRESSGAEASTEGFLEGPCEADEECGPGMRCESGECSEGARECREDGDCGFDSRCVFGTCGEGARECAQDDDCGPRSRCEAGTCGEGARECSQDDDCGPQSRCEAGTCGEGERECWSDVDCGPSSRCEAGTCGEGERECSRDRDCGESSRCVFGTCGEGARQCYRDGDCSVGWRCVFGVCGQGSRQCHDARDCTEGQRCEYGRCESDALTTFART